MSHFIPRRRSDYVKFALAMCYVLACFSTPTHAADPSPPCASKIHPAPSAIGAPLAVEVWYAEDYPNAWQPPACMHWQRAPFSILLAASGEFEFDGTSATLAARIGRISALNAVQYWSVTKQRWRPLITNAIALTSADRDTAREDFSTEELTPGSTYFFRQKENTPAGEIVYQASILELSDRKLRVQIVNPQPVRRFFKEWISAGEYQSYYEFTKLDRGRWHYFYVLRSNAVSWMPVERYENSYKNRAVALFRYFAGIPTTLEPPQFRH